MPLHLYFRKRDNSIFSDNSNLAILNPEYKGRLQQQELYSQMTLPDVAGPPQEAGFERIKC
jgi:hypothetical protein